MVTLSYLSNTYSRKIPQNYLSIYKHPNWYLPHRTVMNVNKQKKVSVVYDCAAKCNGISLNDAHMKDLHLTV